MGAAVVTVQADTRAETESLLAQLCAAHDLQPMASGRAFEMRRMRWMARAQKTQDEPAEG